MKRIFFLTVLTLPIFVLAFIGCSSSDSPTDPTGSNPTDTATYQAVNDIAGELVFTSYDKTLDMTGTILEEAFPGYFATGGKQFVNSKAASDSIVINGEWNHTFDGSWHVFEFSATIHDLEEGMSMVAEVVDSIQFLAGDLVLAEPGETLDGLNIRNHFDWFQTPDSLFYGDGHHRLNLQFNFGEPYATLVLTGEGAEDMHVYFADSLSACSFDVGFTQNLNTLVVPMDEGPYGDCPLDGSLSVGARLDIGCLGSSAEESFEVHANWEMEAEVLEPGSIAITYTDGTTSWSSVETCEATPPVTVSSWGYISR